MSAKPMTRTAALRRDLKLAIARAEKAEARSEAEAKDYDTACETIAELERRLAAMTASRDRLAALVRATDCRVAYDFSPTPSSVDGRVIARRLEIAARAAVDAAGDITEGGAT